MSAPTVVAVLDKLEAKGMAARYRSTVDRRVVHVRLTDAGRQALQTSPGLLGDGFLAALSELPYRERLAMAQAVERLAVLMQPRSRFTEIPRELPDIGMPSPAFPPTRRD